MANAYDTTQVTITTTGSPVTVFTASASTTLVKSVRVMHGSGTSSATLGITKSGGTRTNMNTVSLTANESTNLITEVLPLAAGDSLTVQASHQPTYVWVSVVESTVSVSGQSINVLTDVDITTTAPTNGQVLIWNDSDSEFQPGTAGGSTATLDDIGNVDTAAKNTNDVLLWDGSDWIGSNRLTTVYSTLKEGASTTLNDGANTNSQLELSGTTSKLKTGVTGLEITETSPGDIEFIVATDATGATAHTAVHIDGSTTGNSTDVRVMPGSNLQISNGTQYTWLRANTGNTQPTTVQLPTGTGTLALESYVATDSAVAANTAKVGITTAQANAITANSAKISYTDASAVAANTAKNSYPSADASKLAGIAAGAEVNVNADWNATSGDAQILNKPTIPTNTNLANTDLTAADNRTYDQDGNDLIIDPNGGQFEVNDSSGLPTGAEIQVGQGVLQLQGLTYPASDGTNGQVLTTNGSGTLSFTTVSGGGGSGGIGTSDQTLDADRTIDTNGFNLDIELDGSGTADTFTIHDGTNDLFQVDTNTTGTIFSVNDVSGLPQISVNANGMLKQAGGIPLNVTMITSTANYASADQRFFPIGTSESPNTTLTNHTDYESHFCPPFNGKLLRVVCQFSLADPGSTVVGFHKASNAGSFSTTASATSTVSPTWSSPHTNPTVFDFANEATDFDVGDVLAFSFDSTNTTYYVSATFVFAVDPSNNY